MPIALIFAIIYIGTWYW